jgi:NAD dependent epimerase/dehydratase
MEWKNQTVLVTGAGGFIGSHLTERLATLGCKTRALVHYNANSSWGFLDASPMKKDIEAILGDLRDPESMRKAVQGTDIIFHLGALIGIPYSYISPLSYVRTNIEGTANLLRLALDAGVKRFVQTSTSEVYGTASRIPIDETHPLQAQSPYAASKIGADKLVESFYLSFNLPVSILRPFNTYGPRQSARAIIPTIISQALTQPQLTLGNTQPTRDFNFVSDTVEGFVHIAESEKAIGKTIHIGPGKEISIGDLAKTILKLLNKDLPIISQEQKVRPENSEVERLCADNRRAKEILGWQPKWSLTDGLSQTIQWIKGNIDKYKTQEYNV